MELIPWFNEPAHPLILRHCEAVAGTKRMIFLKIEIDKMWSVIYGPGIRDLPSPSLAATLPSRPPPPPVLWCGASLVCKGEPKAEGLSSGERGLVVIW